MGVRMVNNTESNMGKHCGLIEVIAYKTGDNDRS